MLLADREELVSSTLSSISDPLIVFDESGDIVKMNTGASRLEKMLRHDYGYQLLDAPCIHLDIKKPVSMRQMVVSRKWTKILLSAW